MPKRSLRARVLAERRALDYEAWHASSVAAQHNLLALAEYAAAESIALYAPAHNETDTALIFSAASAAGKHVLYPVICGQHMVMRSVECLDDLCRGAFGIPEPARDGFELCAAEINLIVVPGIAFDLCGHRIGYGKGFYDRFLHSTACRAHLVGLCHDFQVVPEPIPADPHDIAMEMIVTETRVIRTDRSV